MYISFLWHMHQPFYKDIFKNGYFMPWSFLHGIKDYYDMVEILNEFENIKINFNFVPSLLEQIEDYSENPYQDYFIKILSREVSTLNIEEKNNILRQIFCINYDKMVLPYKRFRKLFENNEFTNQELLDIEVLYLIGWSGYYLKQKSEIIQELIKKGEFFTENDKQSLIKELFKFIKELIPKYKEKISEGKVEISTSPYYHPILPLLVDINNAKIAIPNINLPAIKNNFKDDAFEQIKLGIDKFYNVFGKKCNGMWPSEGSVSEEVISLIKENGINWIATDEDILFLSRKNSDKRALYYPYNFNGINIFFRDKDLSNLIGFIYSKWNYTDAATDFYKRIKNIQSVVNDENAVISVILDGENAWEFYEDNGIPFLREIYNKIIDDDSLQFTTFTEYNQNIGSNQKLSKIFPGSWINANYGIWIGHEEENKAWELIDNAKSVLLNAKDKVKKENFNLAKKELLIAEGSDWFWWYGDDFYSEMSDKFDSLFRAHIANVYSFLNEDVPFNVFKPIKKMAKDNFVKLPSDNIEPVIDGKITDYFEWISAGLCVFSNRSSTMHYGDYCLTKLYYGFNKKNLFLRIDALSNINEIFKDSLLEINIDNSEFFKVEYDFNSKNVDLIKEKRKISHNINIKHDDIIEISIPFIDCNFTFGENIKITIEIVKDDNLMERAPYDSAVTIKIPENLELEYWSV